MIAGDNRPQPVGCRWTTSSPACGSRICPQPVDIFCPRIHNHLTWSDGPSPVAPVDTIWTTSQSPGCGRKKVTESVEGGRNPAGIRTAGARSAGLKRRRASGGSAPDALRTGFGRAPNGLRIGREPRRSSFGEASEWLRNGSDAGPETAADRLWTPLRPSARLRDAVLGAPHTPPFRTLSTPLRRPPPPSPAARRSASRHLQAPYRPPPRKPKGAPGEVPGRPSVS